MGRTMTSPAAEIATYKALGVFGVTAFSSVPFLMGVIEPTTFADIEARGLYCLISAISAIVTLTFFRPKDRRETAGRLLAAVVTSFCFVEPFALKLRPYTAQTAVGDAAPIAAALPAAVFLGICGWWVIGFAAWMVKNPFRILKLVEWWRGKETLQSALAGIADPGSALETKTNGGSQEQPGILDTRTPSTNPTQVSTPATSADGLDRSKTT